MNVDSLLFLFGLNREHFNHRYYYILDEVALSEVKLHLVLLEQSLGQVALNLALQEASRARDNIAHVSLVNLNLLIF